MKRILLTLTLLAGALLGGCTMTETASERCRRIANINEIQARQLVEDHDYIWLYEKPTYLTPWHIDSGLP